MRVRNYHEACDKLSDKLSEYLTSRGIDTSKPFKCINPEHDDHDPSCSIAPSGKVFHCFGCLKSGGIFLARHYLENKSLSGPDFVQDNLKPLAEQFGIELELDAYTEEDLYRWDTYRAYKIASDLIINGKKTELFEKAIKERGWYLEICKEYGVGCVSKLSEFKEALKDLGFPIGFQKDVDLSRPDIFGEDRLIFTIHDEWGKPVGFASRNLSYTEDKSNGAKYINQSCTGLKCNIYQKSQRLYGFNRVLKKHQKKPKPIYIFEGYSDVITAAQNGIDNCVALGGLALTLDQVYLLKEHGYSEIYLCLDGDDPGKNKIISILDNVLGNHKDLRVKIVLIPEGQDPDSFIREHGPQKFLKLKKHTAFEWRLQRFPENTEAETICSAMIPLIVNESSYVTQEEQCKILAKETGISLKTIQNELERLQNKKAAELDRERQIILDKLVRTMQKDPTDAEQALHEAEVRLFELSRQYQEDTFSEESTLNIIAQQKEVEETRDGTFSGFRLGQDLKNLEKALCGDWRRDVWICLGAKANAGKTSLLAKLLYEISANIDDNNATVIYHTIDDTTSQVLPKFVCVAEGSRKLSLNQVMDPNYHVKLFSSEIRKKELLDRRSDGYQKVMNLVHDGRLIIKDANDGVSVAYADMLIKYYKEKYPDRNIVYVLDNFHKLQDFANKQDERVKFKELSTIIKGLATKHHITIITTVEYKKIMSGQKGGNQDISECLAGHTQILNMTTGLYQRLDSIEAGITVATLDDKNEKIVPQKVLKVWDKGMQATYKVTTKTGRVLETTLNHPFYTDTGWRKLQELSTKDWIGIPRILRIEKPESILSDDLGRLLGYLAGDGSYCSTPGFINKESDYYLDVNNLVTSNFNLKIMSRDNKGSKDIQYTIGRDKTRTNPLSAWLKDIGIWGQKGEYKTIPNIIFNSKLSVQANYLAGLFATDGSVQSGKFHRISFASKSRSLIYGVQSLLLRFGIQSSISCNKKTKMFSLRIRNQFIKLFAKQIPLSGPKGKRLQEILNSTTAFTCSGDSIPPAYVALLKQERAEQKLPVRLHNKFWIQKRTMNRTIAQQYILENKNSKYSNQINSDIFWDQIKTIEEIGSQHVWDLTVENTHNFVANDIFCHNTAQIEYDANLIAHLHNEMHDKGDKAESHWAHDDISPEEEMVRMPRVQLEIGKNKITAFKEKLWFDFFPRSSDFIEVSLDQIQEEISTNKEEKKGRETQLPF